MKKHYYTIGEVSNLLELKTHVLRYWEKEFPQLNPKKSFGRNRRYDAEDIELLKKIKYMLHHQNYTIKGARKKLAARQRSKEQMQLDFVEDKEEVKQNIISELEELRQIIKSPAPGDEG
jgi:DNA-binding transcriptional MerR regulator